jgi:signal transduction histidine kinase
VNLPIRFRLTAWYVSLLAALVVGLGAFVVLRLQSDLGGQIDDEVTANAAQIARGYAYEGPEDFLDVSRTVLPHETAVAQIIDSGGRPVVSYGALVPGNALVSPARRRVALGTEAPRLEVLVLGPERERYRALVRSVRRARRRYVLVVGESLEPVEDSVERVLLLLLLAGPAALGLTAAGGWWLARMALLPVERMTTQADAIGIDHLHERIAVPRARDEIGHLADTLNEMLDRLQRGVDDKRRLVEDASHELRTPLAVMRAELDVSLRVDTLTDPARSVLESVRDEVDSMSRTVDNLMTLAEVHDGTLDLLITDVRMRDAIEAAARPFRQMAVGSGLRLETGGDPGAGPADPQRLHQALTNIIENAIKSARPGGCVSVTSWDRSREVGVTVADDGPGILAAADAPLHDHFHRGDRPRGANGGGSGLGLAICQQIAAAHGGRFWVDSETGKGSACTLALPRRLPPSPDAGLATRSAEPSAQRP